MLLTQTYSLNALPPREVIYQRQCRFKEHCKKLGIPNPYSVKEIIEADRRWQKLHKNAVPPLMDIARNNIDFDGKQISISLQGAQNIEMEDVDFSF